MLNYREVSGISKDIYVFTVERWSIRGVRDIDLLQITACPFTNPEELLNDELAERLVTSAARKGTDWQAAATEVELEKAGRLADKLLTKSEYQYESYIQQVEHENEDRADIQEKSVRTHLNSQLDMLQTIKQRQLDQGKERIARMTQGRIDALLSRLSLRLEEIQQRRDLRSDKHEICIGLIKVAN